MRLVDLNDDGDPLGAQRISDSDRRVTLPRPARPEWMGKREHNSTYREVEIRLTDVKINKLGSRAEDFTIASTMLDCERYPGEWLGSFYEGRWLIEPDIESIKCTMNLEHLCAQRPEGIERELWTGQLTYNLVRIKMLQSGYAANREIRSMSFTETYLMLSTNWLLCACTDVNEAMSVACQA